VNSFAMEWARAMTDVAPLLVPIVGSIALFSFLAVASWADSRRREREAFFRHELLKKLAENPGSNADQVMQLLRQEETDRLERQRNGLRLGGWVTLAVGIGVMLLLSQLVREHGLWAVGAIPTLIGAALLLHAFSLMRKAAPNR
jgi:hypothetical protein